MTLEQIEFLANGLMDIHELHDWAFRFGNAKTAVGTCSYRRRTIFLSKAFVLDMSEEDITDTILHEIAHALTPGHKHNEVWRAKFISIGGKGETTAKNKKTPSRIERGAKWVCVCPALKVRQSWFRRPHKKTFDDMPFRYVKGEKDATYGKLKIITIDEYNRLTKR